MKLALHRSVIFWAGILVMGFIVWAWRDSMSYRSQVGRYGYHLSHSQCAGMLSNSSGGAPELYFYREPELGSSTEPQVFPPAAFLQGQGSSREDFQRHVEAKTGRETLFEQLAGNAKFRPRGDWTLFLPHWFILLAVALTWSALLLWRARRRNRISLP